MKQTLLYPFRVAATVAIFIAAGAIAAYTIATGADKNWQG